MRIEGSYSERRREAVVRSLPTLAISATDSYVGAATAYNAFGLAAAGAEGVLPFASGALAAYHGLRVLRNTYLAFNAETLIERRRAQTRVLGHLAIGAGLVGLAAGMGPAALPILAIGELTNLYANFH